MTADDAFTMVHYTTLLTDTAGHLLTFKHFHSHTSDVVIFSQTVRRGLHHLSKSSCAQSLTCTHINKTISASHTHTQLTSDASAQTQFQFVPWKLPLLVVRQLCRVYEGVVVSVGGFDDLPADLISGFLSTDERLQSFSTQRFWKTCTDYTLME